MASFSTIDRWMQVLQECEDKSKRPGADGQPEIDMGRLCTEIRSVLLLEMQRGDELMAALMRCRFDSLNMSMEDLKAIQAAVAKHTTKEGSAA